MLCGISSSVPLLSLSMGQVAHALLTRPPLSHPEQAPGASFDLHVLSTPPAFILSQDQTLLFKFFLTGLKLGLFPFPCFQGVFTVVGMCPFQTSFLKLSHLRK